MIKFFKKKDQILQEGEILDITIAEFMDLEETSEYDIFINTLEPTATFAGHRTNPQKYTFDEVEVIKKTFAKPDAESIKDLIIKLYNLKGDITTSSNEQYYNASIFDLFRAQKFLRNYIIKIHNLEKKWLTEDFPDVKLESINANNRLAPFSQLLTKTQFAKDYAKTPWEIGTWNYNKIFTILVAQKISKDIQREYSQQK